MLVSESMAAGNCLYNSQLIDEIKNVETASAFAKFQLVSKAFNNRNSEIISNALTVQRASQHYILSFFSPGKMFVIFIGNILQAYTLYKICIQRSVYVRPPLVLKISPGMLLRSIDHCTDFPKRACIDLLLIRDSVCPNLEWQLRNTTHATYLHRNVFQNRSYLQSGEVSNTCK